MDPIPFRKAGDNVSSMLENASNEIVGDTDIKRTAKAARQDVNPVNSLSLSAFTSTAITGSPAFAGDDRRGGR